MTDHPSYELVQRFMHEAGFDVPDPDKEPVFLSSEHMKLASRLIRYGMDYELEECIQWMVTMGYWGEDGKAIPALRAARRPSPKPPSLKGQALEQLDCVEGILRNLGVINTDKVRRALEALPE
jgi:hypothetical protein